MPDPQVIHAGGERLPEVAVEAVLEDREVRGPELHVLDRVVERRGSDPADAEILRELLAGIGKELHQAERALVRLAEVVESALDADHADDEPRIHPVAVALGDDRLRGEPLERVVEARLVRAEHVVDLTLRGTVERDEGLRRVAKREGRTQSIAVLDGERFLGVLTPSSLHGALRRSVGAEAEGSRAEDVVLDTAGEPLLA